MKTAVSLPDGLFEAADRLARRLGISRSRVFQRALSAFVQAHRDESVTDALDAVYGKGANRARLDPVLEKLQSASIPSAEW